MDDIEKKAEEWVKLNRPNYLSWGDGDSDLQGMAIAAYLAGAKERDLRWVDVIRAFGMRGPASVENDKFQNKLDAIIREALEES